MQVRVFSIGLEADLLENDQNVLNDFLTTVAFKKSSTQFVESENSWSVIVHYEEAENLKNTPLET